MQRHSQKVSIVFMKHSSECLMHRQMYVTGWRLFTFQHSLGTKFKSHKRCMFYLSHFNALFSWHHMKDTLIDKNISYFLLYFFFCQLPKLSLQTYPKICMPPAAIDASFARQIVISLADGVPFAFTRTVKVSLIRNAEKKMSWLCGSKHSSLYILFQLCASFQK